MPPKYASVWVITISVIVFLFYDFFYVVFSRDFGSHDLFIAKASWVGKSSGCRNQWNAHCLSVSSVNRLLLLLRYCYIVYKCAWCKDLISAMCLNCTASQCCSTWPWKSFAYKIYINSRTGAYKQFYPSYMESFLMTDKCYADSWLFMY